MHCEKTSRVIMLINMCCMCCAQNVSCIIASYAIAFSSSWSMTLVATAVLPMLAFALQLQNVQYVKLAAQVGACPKAVHVSRCSR